MNNLKEMVVRYLTEISEDEFEGMVAALKFYDAELGRLENGCKDRPYDKLEYRAYLEQKCSNLQTQCCILYKLLQGLGGAQ